MTSPTIPVRILNAATSAVARRPVLVDAAFEATSLQWCWQCRRRLHESEFAGAGVRCTECLVTASRVNDARLALRLLITPNRPATVRRLTAWRCMAHAVTKQAELLGIDLTDAPLPEPTTWVHEGAAS